MEQTRNRNYQRVDKLIIDAFCELLKRSGERSITITELCEQAGVNRTTFYKHYQGTWQIIDMLEEQLIESMEGNKPDIISFLNNPYPRFQELNRLLEQDIEFYRRLFNTQHVEKIMSKMNAIVLKSVTSNKETMKKYNGNVNQLKIVIDINIGVIVHLYLSWFKNNYGNTTLDDIAQIISRAIRRMNSQINSK